MPSTIEYGPRQGLTDKATADGRPVHPGEQQHRVKGVLRRCDSLANRPWRLCQRDKGNADPRLLKHVACLGLETNNYPPLLVSLHCQRVQLRVSWGT